MTPLSLLAYGLVWLFLAVVASLTLGGLWIAIARAARDTDTARDTGTADG